VVFTYRFAGMGAESSITLRQAFERFRGAGKDLFAALGGGEAFLRAEREAWEQKKP
jgi:hypothetical protein